MSRPAGLMDGCGSWCGQAEVGCPCEPGGHPIPVTNPAGLTTITYRAGDFVSFCRAMLAHLPGEHELTGWRPTASTDLALQVLDWWAYVADVLTFYCERIANESYLGTATLPESLRRLVETLGYRPRPGIGATATLAVIAAGPGPITLSAGFAVMSKALPNLPAQVFETSRDATFSHPTSAPSPPPEDPGTPPGAAGPPPEAPAGAAEPPAHSQLLVRGGVLVKGKPSAVGVGDRLLLARRDWPSVDSPAAVVTVTGLVTERGPHRRVNTRVLLAGAKSLAAEPAADFRLQRATRVNHLATLPAGAAVVTNETLTLDATSRALHPGDPLLVELPGAGNGKTPGSDFDLVRLKKYEELVWYANGGTGDPPAPPPKDGIPLLVARLTVDVVAGTKLSTRYSDKFAELQVRSGWQDVGQLLDTPVTSVTGVPSHVTLACPPAVPAGVATPALVEDAQGHGVAVSAIPQPGSSEVTLTPAEPGAAGTLEPPLRLLWDLVPVTRGETVRDEMLGTGDATRPGQDFVLNRSPVTYLSDTAQGGVGGAVTGRGSRSGDGYSSTVDLVVDGRRWTEIPTLYAAGPAELVFATREDEEGRTHVLIGDGVHGARLRTGAVVTATYRVGSGAAAPSAGTLTQVLRPVPGLSGVRNPVAAGGGADPDPPARLRELAPRSVLTFGRAVSGDDYVVVAAQAPGVTRAAAEWAWDPTEQRCVVRVWVGDDDAAVSSARNALRAQADPNRPVVVKPVVQLTTTLELTLRLDPAYLADEVVAAVRTALLDAPDGLFAPGVLGLGAPLYRSRIEAACDLPGVLAVHDLWMQWQPAGGSQESPGPRFEPGAGGWFDLQPGQLNVYSMTAGEGGNG